MRITIGHLYPDLMDTYGDRGNIITITQRCLARSIEVKKKEISLNDSIKKEEVDFFFFGGGQDRAQNIVAKNLREKSKTLLAEIENGVVLLAICGGYQLLQNYYKPHGEKKLPGLGVFDAHTIASQQRMIGNLLIKTNKKNSAGTQFNGDIVGFENHSGKTFLSKKCTPLGIVVVGFGNNGEDRTEGAVFKNAIGCYLHGSLLPKNPRLADYLITKALERKYGKVKLAALNDTIEEKARHRAALRAFQKATISDKISWLFHKLL